VARQAGIDPDAVRARFPDIAYTHLNAYGNEGIWRDRPGFEQVVQAVSGIQLSYGEGGRPRLLTTPVIDIGSGLMGAFATLLGLYRQARTGAGVFVTTHLTRTAVLLQARQVAAFQRERALATAAARGRPVAWDPARQVVAGIVRVSDGHACIAGPEGDVRQWIERAGLDDGGASGASGGGNPIASLAGAVRRRKVAAIQESVRAAGLAGAVAVTPVVRVRRLLDDLARSHPDGGAPAFRRDYPGCASQLSFVRGPVRLSATPAVDISPPRMRGSDTRDVLARVGVAVPEGEGVIPYPKNKPFLPWLLSFIRWGYFAWRSGNI
jgi:crotonobetainyl-CoA:carnitine CoA-transferase CaiB-like acyl-CoA transferase